MAKKWLEVLEDILYGKPPEPVYRDNAEAFIFGDSKVPKNNSFMHSSRYDRPISRDEADSANRNNYGLYDYSDEMNSVSRDNSSTPIMQSSRGRIDDKNTWTKNQFYSTGKIIEPRKTTNRIVQVINDINLATNRRINRGAMAGLKLGESLGIISPQTAYSGRKAVRNTAFRENQWFQGKNKVHYTDWDPYHENKLRAEQARIAGKKFLGSNVPRYGDANIESNAHAIEATIGLDSKLLNKQPYNNYWHSTGEYQYRQGLADNYKPSSAYKNARKALKASIASTLLYGIYSPFSNENTNPGGSGVSAKKRLHKKMDMRTQTPRMPSTKRDIRNTDKYFN
jgi:hypothetical protein